MLLQSSSNFGLYFHEVKKKKLRHIDTRFLIEVLLRPIYTVQLCRMRYAYDKSTTGIVSCKSNLQLACDCRVRHEECRGLLKHVLKPYDNRSDRQFYIVEIVYDFSMTRAARAIKIACDNRKQKSYRVNRPLHTEFESLSASKKQTSNNNGTATTTKTEILGIRCHSAVLFKSLKVFDFAYETNPKIARKNQETVNLPGQSNARSLGPRM